MSKILIKNIKELVQVLDANVIKFSGDEMANLSTIKSAWLAIEDDTIIGFGDMIDFPEITDWNDLEIIDASGKMVFPAWCDSHTHIVFAKTREEEFVDRIKGLTYQEIAAKGGGILNSAKKLQNASEEELYKGALKRIKEIQLTGTGAVEIKSGYGLSLDAELKMLRVIKRLKESCEITIKANFLGAHAIPAEFKENRRGYIDLIINEMLPIIEKEHLADFIDTFCETNYYTPEETNEILEAGIKIGLIPKIHVNQFTSIGGIQVGIKNNALSVDHLEVMTDQDISDLSKSEVMPTLLPSCSFFLNIPYAPAKQLIEKGLPIALATDFNPGSTPSGNMSFVLSLACIYMKLTPEQAINAATINAAYAMGLEKTHGSITVGKKANIFITEEISSIAHLPYYFGHNQIEQVIINGKLMS
ncbi:imidazolonepropionase [Vicingus serpentipes]|uniref:Imidazolonepropionase n=1 Tax=Vicingus serpentipes TaxID=1926625 RepID=A0A5C6RZG5_9FLAO|nr:imidazolonepropionase [Vicingus serpentipes]TXB66762.1 imidazolonepropionase [Vicingus serpentipes]